jgi:hypothetical protein
MFETLSAIGLTLGASIVVAFLAHALARTSSGRLTIAGVLAAWFALVLAIGATGVLSPGDGAGVPGLGLTVAAPVAALIAAFFAVRPIRDAMLETPLPARRGQRDPGSGRPFCHSLRRWEASRAVRSERWLGRHLRRRDGAAARLGDAQVRPARPAARVSLERDRVGGPHQCGRARRLIGPRSASSFHGPSDQHADDHFAVAHHSGLSGPEPHVHSRRHLLSSGEDRGRGAGASAARRRRGEGWRGLNFGYRLRRDGPLGNVHGAMGLWLCQLRGAGRADVKPRSTAATVS